MQLLRSAKDSAAAAGFGQGMHARAVQPYTGWAAGEASPSARTRPGCQAGADARAGHHRAGRQSTCSQGVGAGTMWGVCCAGAGLLG